MNRLSCRQALHPLAAALVLGLSGCATGISSHDGKASMTNDADDQAIRQVLDNYTQSVSSGNQALFESQLLDEKIPFFGLGGTLDPDFKPGLASVQDYASFRKGVFESGTKFKQRFFNVKIEHDGDLAQASLNFETIRTESGDGGQGWKTLQLLKVAGHWKIVSEFYTVYDLKP